MSGSSLQDIRGLTTFGQHGYEVVKNDTYEIIDMPLRDRFGIVRQTISRTLLYPNKVTKGHMHKNEDEIYYFIKGSGLMILHGHDWSEIREIEPESYLYIERETFHQVVNTSKNEDMEFQTIYPGESDRPHLNGIIGVNTTGRPISEPSSSTKKKK
jgi:oxalate decarboxylase/phosphoglucose isomerase-like protein (cupin superfamily)